MHYLLSWSFFILLTFVPLKNQLNGQLKKVWILTDCATVPESDPQPWIELNESRSSSPSNGARQANQAAYQRVRTISSLDGK